MYNRVLDLEIFIIKIIFTIILRLVVCSYVAPIVRRTIVRSRTHMGQAHQKAAAPLARPCLSHTYVRKARLGYAPHLRQPRLAAAFRSPDDCPFLADARVAVPCPPYLDVHPYFLLRRSPFLRAVFARRAVAGGSSPCVQGVRLELRELLDEEVGVG